MSQSTRQLGRPSIDHPPHTLAEATYGLCNSFLFVELLRTCYYGLLFNMVDTKIWSSLFCFIFSPLCFEVYNIWKPIKLQCVKKFNTKVSSMKLYLPIAYFLRKASCFEKTVRVAYFLRKLQVFLKNWWKLHISWEKCSLFQKIGWSCTFHEKSETFLEKMVELTLFFRKVQLVSKFGYYLHISWKSATHFKNYLLIMQFVEKSATHLKTNWFFF
jgi:hypothetical protein